MADTDFDAENTAGAENTADAADSIKAADPAKTSPPNRKKRAAAAVVVGVLVILLGIAGWVFLFPHSEAPVRAAPGPRPFSETDKALLQAVRDDDAGKVSGLLRAGADINARDSFGVSPMRAAIALNRLDIVRQFLETAGESPFVREDNTLLIYAIIQNRAEIAQEFLKLGIDIDRTDKNGYTPLRYAVDRNLTAVARELLKAGADVNRIDRHGQTPLMFAVTVGRPDMISLLLESGADTGIASPEGDTAMSLAQRRNRNVIISLLLNAGSPLFY
jgi:ankyrin repeat protein